MINGFHAEKKLVVNRNMLPTSQYSCNVTGGAHR